MAEQEPALNMWDPALPKLQTAWDSVSFGALMKCPRYYQYTIVDGIEVEKVDFTFGRLAASGFELYKKERLRGASKSDAMVRVSKWALEATFPDPFGTWIDAWHCTGTEPYRNGKGNHAKCPHAHKGAWEMGEDPKFCPLCSSPTFSQPQYVPDSPKKNRVSLLRALVWWMLEQPEDLEDGMHPYKFPDGTFAVEHSFTLPLPRYTPGGVQYTLSGHLDDISEFGLEHYISDNKTTGTALSKAAEGYSPHYQLDTYDLVGSILWPDLIDGISIDLTQLLQEGVKFGRYFFRKTENLREEHWRTLEYWISQAEAFAAANYWPMNKASCWNCPFSKICSTDPDERHRFLNALPRREWNPLIPR